MGARNVAAVFTHWTHLPHVPFRVLVFMALVAKDGDPAPRYWGGVEPLAEALGRSVMPFGEVAHRDQVAVSSALTVLVRAGALRVVVRPARGRRGEYAVVIDPPTTQAQPEETPVDNSPIGQAEPEQSRIVRAGMVRLSLTDDQAEPDIYQGEPDLNQAEPGPKEVKENKRTGRRQTTDVGNSPGRVVALGMTDHGCIRGWLPDDDDPHRRSTTPCPTCLPRTALPAAAPN